MYSVFFENYIKSIQVYNIYKKFAQAHESRTKFTQAHDICKKLTQAHESETHEVIQESQALEFLYLPKS